MLSASIMRSVATLGVVAGLLAAATAPRANSISGQEMSDALLCAKAPSDGLANGFLNGCAPGWSAPARQVSVGAGKDRGWDGSMKADAATKAGGEVIGDF
jgi:hypothetical protein